VGHWGLVVKALRVAQGIETFAMLLAPMIELSDVRDSVEMDAVHRVGLASRMGTRADAGDLGLVIEVALRMVRDGDGGGG
jgi:hypothetical protein